MNAWRGDLADVALAGTVTASHYSVGQARRCAVARTTIRSRGDAGATAMSELLFGETFTVFEQGPDWAWGQCGHDDYVGWVAADALAPDALADSAAPTHRIVGAMAPVFAAPDIKSPVVARLPLNARIVATRGDGAFVATATGWIHARHVAATITADDPAAVAARFAGVPYVWGGRTHDGIDCSGLTQAALLACGFACPRDSDQQRDWAEPIDAGARRRGDLVFFPGHVGILADAETLIHANAFWMATVVEPLAATAARTPMTGVARPRRA